MAFKGRSESDNCKFYLIVPLYNGKGTNYKNYRDIVCLTMVEEI